MMLCKYCPAPPQRTQVRELHLFRPSEVQLQRTEFVAFWRKYQSDAPCMQ